MNLESSLGLKNMLLKSHEVSGRFSAFPQKVEGRAHFPKNQTNFQKSEFLYMMKIAKSYENDSESTSRCHKHNFQQMLNYT